MKTKNESQSALKQDIEGDIQTEIIIYPTYMHSDHLKKFTPQKFRKIDSSDAPGIALKVFSFFVSIVGGAHPLNPLFRQTYMPDSELLSTGISSLKQLANRGKVYLPKDQFLHIDPLYVFADVADWIRLGKDKQIHPKDNPFFKNGYTRTPTLKDNWSVVYIISLRSPEEVKVKGLDHGYITLTSNDAAQLCKLIVAGNFPPPSDEYLQEEENDNEQSVEPISPEARIFKFDESMSVEEKGEEFSEDRSFASHEEEVLSPVDNKLRSSRAHFFQPKQTEAIDIPQQKVEPKF
jgi:hypothetical protein